MPAKSGSVFSETLQEITNAKLEELSKRRSEFETTRRETLTRLEAEKDPVARLRILSQGVKDSYAVKTTKAGLLLPGQSMHPDLKVELGNLDTFLAQSAYDPSVTPRLMRTWEEVLLRHLSMQSSKFEYASLYAQLVTEWLSTEKSGADETEDVAMTEGFEDVAGSLKKEARMGWERVVFEPGNVDVAALETYLARLFGTRDREKPARAKCLAKLRDAVTAFENAMAAPNQFDPDSLSLVINSLLAGDLLTDERREVLRDFASNQIILAEVADVLNMRLAALSTWSWGESVALEQRRKITGIYNVLMHEDVLQAIFLEYIGIKWSVRLKAAFKQYRRSDEAWASWQRPIPNTDLDRRSYYFNPMYSRRKYSLQYSRRQLYNRYYFMASLMNHDQQQRTSLEGEQEADYAKAAPTLLMQAQAQAQAQNAHSSHHLQDYQVQLMFLEQQNKKRLMMARQEAQAPTRRRSAPMGPPPMPPAKPLSRNHGFPYEDDDDDDDDADDGIYDRENRRPMEDKQRLIRLLSAEIAINTKLYGEITAFHSAFESWNSLLSHETILTVMSHLGVSETWIQFFTKFLRAPLKFLDEDAATPPRIRRRGTPASHMLSEVFGESILFCLDLAVNQATNGCVLHRIHDDFWFWSRDHDVAKRAWKAVSEFADATRTYISAAKSGTVRIPRDPSAVKLDIDESLPPGDIRWGFLKLSTESGRFEIDEAMVDQHIVDLRRQLVDKRRSVISFIQTWNTFAATFFTSNFGKPANCFGRAHVDQILATHQRIQREVFASSPESLSPLLAGEAPPDAPITGVVDYLKHVLASRFGVRDIPDAYLFFPVELGGLDLRSPFISVLPVRESILPAPDKVLDEFLEAEREDYEKWKKANENTTSAQGQGQTPQEAGAGSMTGSRLPDAPGVDQRRYMGPFPTFEEYTRYREDLVYNFPDNLGAVFEKLLRVPVETSEFGISEASASVRAAVEALASSGITLNGGGAGDASDRGITGNWSSMTAYWRWVAQLYGPEAINRFGGLNIVEPGLLPMGMVSIFRDKRVKWQG